MLANGIFARYPWAKYALIAIGTLLLAHVLTARMWSDSARSGPGFFISKSEHVHPAPNTPEAHQFWTEFTEALVRGKPSFPEIARAGSGVPMLIFDRKKQETPRPELLDLTQDQYQELSDLRARAIDDFAKMAPRMPFVNGTRGIVATAGSDAFGILTTSLWTLRAAGSILPAEIWLYKHDQYEREACDEIFPALNARCMFLVDYLPPDLQYELPVVKFTYKALAMIFSTFEQAIFIDNDVLTTSNPDRLFDKEPFHSIGAVLWPDYWADTAAKEMYEMSGQEAPDMTMRATTESGEMIFNKATHGAALLMSTWFNTWGPEYWHRLVSQGAPGEGDKDLWKFSCDAFNLPWYQVQQAPQRVGYICDGNESPVGTAQSHPVDDFKIVRAGLVRDKHSLLSLGLTAHPRIIFVHANLPKLDPYLLIDWVRISPEWNHVIRCNGTGPVHPLLGQEDFIIAKYGWDVEKSIWNAFVWMTCKHEHGYKIWTEPSWWRPTPRTDLCIQFEALWEEHYPGETWSREPPNPAKSPIRDRLWGGIRERFSGQ